jgi:hypothetical protein
MNKLRSLLRAQLGRESIKASPFYGLGNFSDSITDNTTRVHSVYRDLPANKGESSNRQAASYPREATWLPFLYLLC